MARSDPEASIKTGYDDMGRFKRAPAGIVGKRLTYGSVGGSWIASLTRDHAWRRGSHVADDRQGELLM